MTAYLDQDLNAATLRASLIAAIDGASPRMLRGALSLNGATPRVKLNDFDDDFPLELPDQLLPPPAPLDGEVGLYYDKRMRSFGQVDKFDNYSPLAPDPAFTRTTIVSPTTGGTALTSIGCSTTTAGTATARSLSNTRYFTRKPRVGYVSAATAAAMAEVRCGSNLFTMGNAANSGQGGFKISMLFGCSDAAAVNAARQFCGVRPIGAATNVEPSTLTNCIGIGEGAADNNMRLFVGGSVPQTPIDLGANFPSGSLSTDYYRLTIYAPTNTETRLFVSVERLNTGHRNDYELLATTAGVQLPSWNTFLTYDLWRCNNATLLPVGLDFGGLVIYSPW